MGNYMPTVFSRNGDKKGQKRSRDELEQSDTELDSLPDQNLDTPKRKKLKCTSKYIYETLFLNGENSDVTIKALGKEWDLHKVYLCQSGYFSSMFSGAWKESSQSVINIDIPDENMDEEALQIVFGSLYRDDVYIKPARVVSVLAAATLLQLDGLIHQCAAIMKETISAKTVCQYHTASTLYGQDQVTKKCTGWLEKNVMSSQIPGLLREISCDLMKQIISSPDLFVVQVEMDIYAMLKRWMYLKLFPSWNHGSSKELTLEADQYFKTYSDKNEGTPFLHSEQGSEFSSVLQCLRFQHIINDMTSCTLLETDKIIPTDWIYPWFKNQWQHLLKLEQGTDVGPRDIDKKLFHQMSMRCGRVLQTDGDYCWRWTGYNYGMDLLVTFSNRLIIFKRNTHSQIFTNSVSLQPSRHIMYRVTVVSFNSLGRVEYQKTTGIKTLRLSKDGEVVIMGVDRYASFPLHISVNILYFTPNQEWLEQIPITSHIKTDMKQTAKLCDSKDRTNEVVTENIGDEDEESSITSEESEEM